MASYDSTAASLKTAACDDVRSCKKCPPTVRWAVAIAAISLLITFILSFILFETKTNFRGRIIKEINEAQNICFEELHPLPHLQSRNAYQHSLGCLKFINVTAKWGAAPKEDPTVHKKQLEHLQQCQRECHDLKMMLHSATQDPRCRLCPDGWLWWRSHCYFFSVGLQEDCRWNESVEFCRQQNSSLVVIEDSAEMDFLQGVMRHAAKSPFLWVGLTDGQQEGRWLWLSGSEVQNHLPVVVQWDSDDRDCADLRGGGTLFAADCEEHGPWICKRKS